MGPGGFSTLSRRLVQGLGAAATLQDNSITLGIVFFSSDLTP